MISGASFLVVSRMAFFCHSEAKGEIINSSVSLLRSHSNCIIEGWSSGAEGVTGILDPSVLAVLLFIKNLI